jgi:hypothetical protein
MAKLSKDFTGGTLHPREALFASGSLGALNSELIVAADGAASVSLDLRGTFTLSVEVAGSVDGVNWTTIPVRPMGQTTIAYQVTSFSPFAGVLVGKCSAFRLVRARVVSYTSGAATAVLMADTAPLDDAPVGGMATSTVTVVGAAGAAVTLTVPAPPSGMRNYVTSVVINRFAAAALTAAATPTTVTTTNIAGALALSIPAEAAAQGSIDRWREDFAWPLAGNATGTATTFVCPATSNVIWRATATYFAAP